MIENTVFKLMKTETLKENMPSHYFKDIKNGQNMDFLITFNHQEFLKAFEEATEDDGSG